MHKFRVRVRVRVFVSVRVGAMKRWAKVRAILGLGLDMVFRVRARVTHVF